MNELFMQVDLFIEGLSSFIDKILSVDSLVENSLMLKLVKSYKDIIFK